MEVNKISKVVQTIRSFSQKGCNGFILSMSEMQVLVRDRFKSNNYQYGFEG